MNFERGAALMGIEEAEGGSDTPWERGALGRRAKEMVACGQVVAVRRCSCCGEDRAGSGSFASVQRTCKTRTCPYCSYVRGLRLADLFERALDEVPRVEGYLWQFLTQTFVYEPGKGSEDMGWRGLRSRALAAIKVAGVQWRQLLRGPGAALYRVVEVSPRGAVHTHMVYYGPPVDVDEMRKLAKGVSGRGGIALRRDLQPARFDPHDEAQLIALRRTMRKVALYGLKGMKDGTGHYPKLTHEDWLAGHKMSKGLAAELAARWEAATYGLRLSQPYGKLMGLAPAEDDEDLYAYQEPDDHEVACEKCGAVGEWKTVRVDAWEWFRFCHYKKGREAVEGGRWIPPWLKKRRKRFWKAPEVTLC